MTLVMRCEEKERLVGYLYDEGSAAERAAVEVHLARCGACAAELEGLRAVRVRLAEWDAPDVELGFRVTREREPERRRSWMLPAWAQAAAAVVVLGAGAGLANLQIEYGKEGLRLRTGWGAQAIPQVGNPPGAPSVQTAAAPTDKAVSPGDLAAMEARLRAEIAQNARTVTTPTAGPVMSRDVLDQVRALVDESERRQQKELAFRLAQVVRDVESQRRADLVRIEQNMGQIEGLTGQEVVRQRDMLNYLMRVSQRPASAGAR